MPIIIALVVALIVVIISIALVPFSGKGSRSRGGKALRMPKFPKVKKSKSYQVTGRYGAVRRR